MKNTVDILILLINLCNKGLRNAVKQSDTKEMFENQERNQSPEGFQTST